jgi:hypothetical protein
MLNGDIIEAPVPCVLYSLAINDAERSAEPAAITFHPLSNSVIEVRFDGPIVKLKDLENMPPTPNVEDRFRRMFAVSWVCPGIAADVFCKSRRVSSSMMGSSPVCTTYGNTVAGERLGSLG